MSNIFIANNIRALRKAYKETQDDLAAIIHCEPRTLRKYEHGKLSVNDDVKRLIAKHYCVSVQELMCSDLSNYSLNISKENIKAAVDNSHLFLPIFATEPTRTPYEQSKSAVNRRFCYNMENDSMKLIVKAHE